MVVGAKHLSCCYMAFPVHSEDAALDAGKHTVEVFSELPRQTIERRWNAVNVILRLSMLTGSQMQLDATLKLLCEYSKEIIAYDAALLYFWDERTDSYTLRLSFNFPATAQPAISTSNVYAFWTAKYSQPLLLRLGDNAASDAFLGGISCESCLIVPLFVNNRVMGSLQLFHAKRDHFTTEDAQLMWVLSLVAENLLTREVSNDGLLRFAFTDYLTGLRSRGYFEQQLELEIKRAERKHASFALLMLDIDHFKSFNDNYGHHVGDRVLREVSALLMRDMREVDTVARYGGEEFVIILPETSQRGAMQVAERLRRNVEQTTFHLSHPGAPQRLTISIGVAQYGGDGNHRDELIEAADSALYAAKEKGRNAIVAFEDLGRETLP